MAVRVKAKPAWKEWKRAQRAQPTKPGQRCPNCGSNAELVRHHVKGARNSPITKLMCRKCHPRGSRNPRSPGPTH